MYYFNFTYYSEGFCIMSGKKDTIQAITDELKRATPGIDIDVMEYDTGIYSQIKTDQFWSVDLQKIKTEHPDVEALIYNGAQNNNMHYCQISYPGETEVYNDEFYIHSDGGIDDVLPPPFELAMFCEKERINRNVYLLLKTGERLRYSFGKNVNLEKILHLMETTNITLSLLSELCCPYIASNKKKGFASAFVKSVSSIQNIKEIHIVETTYSREPLSKMTTTQNDPSVLLMLSSYCTTEQEHIFDLETNRSKCTQKQMLRIFDGVSDYTNVEICNEILYDNSILGINDAVCSGFVFENNEKEAVLSACLVDAERIDVPNVDLSTGNEVVEIGAECFKNCSSVIEINIPGSVVCFGKDCFAGAKKLARFLLDGKEEEIVIVSKGKLKGLATLNKEYIVSESVKTIGKNAFAGCPKLKKIKLHSDVKLSNDSLCGCKTLKTIVVDKGTKSINVKALEKAGIKELILEDGTVVRILDKYIYDCIVETQSGIIVSYAKVAQMISKASTESIRFKIAFELLTEQSDYIQEHISDVLEIALRYCIGKGDVKTIIQLFALNLKCDLDFTQLIDLANRTGNTEIIAAVLAHTGEFIHKNIVKKETPAERGPRLYIKVRFEDNKAYSYFCSYKVNPGDKVFVGGKKAGLPGEVVEILNTYPMGRAAMYTIEVERALNVETIEVDEL